MNRNKKILYASAAAVVILLAVVIFYVTRKDSGGGQENAVIKPENWEAEFPVSQALIEEVSAMFDDVELPPFNALMDGLRSGRINLVWELWNLRRQCPENLDRYQCNSRILVYLKEKYPGENGEKLAGIIRRYLSFEEIMSETRMSDSLTMRERYNEMRKKRKEIFNAEEEALVFGMEEAKVDLGDKTAAFFKDTAGMPGDQRMKAFEDMRKKAMGPYYQAFLDDEPSFNRYETEIALRDTDFKNAGSSGSAALTESIRERYFGKEGAARMAAVEKELQENENKVKQYEDAEKKYLAENASLPQAQKDAALAKLRVQYLGAEEAEVYQRRRQYDESMKNLGITP